MTMSSVAAKKSKTSKPAAKAGKPAAAKKAASPRKTAVSAAAAPAQGKQPARDAGVKPAAKPAVKPEMKPASVEKPKEKEKPKKEKVVRDSFTMPESEYRVLGEVKRACLKDGVDIFFCVLFRFGVVLFCLLCVLVLLLVLSALPPMKAGRPNLFLCLFLW